MPIPLSSRTSHPKLISPSTSSAELPHRNLPCRALRWRAIAADTSFRHKSHTSSLPYPVPSHKQCLMRNCLTFKVYKMALRPSQSGATARVESLGAYNTASEFVEAHLVSSYACLATTKGTYLLSQVPYSTSLSLKNLLFPSLSISMTDSSSTPFHATFKLLTIEAAGRSCARALTKLYPESRQLFMLTRRDTGTATPTRLQ